MQQDGFEELIKIKQFIQSIGIEQQLEDDSEVIVLYGVTGTGKTSIAHFLSGSQIEKFRENNNKGAWKVQVKEEQQGQKIGHTLISETDCPQIYKSNKQIIVDLPGQQDNRGWQQSVKNGYLTSMFLNKYKKIKFVLVLDCNSISQRGHLNLHEFLNQIKHTLGYISYDILDSIRILVNKFSIEDYDSSQILREILIDKYTQLSQQLCDKAQEDTQIAVEERAERQFQAQKQSTIRKKQTKVALLQQIGNKLPEDIQEFYELKEKSQINDIEIQQLQDNQISAQDAVIIFKYILVCNEIFGMEKVTQSTNPFNEQKLQELKKWIDDIKTIEIRRATPTIQDSQGKFLQQHENCFQQFKNQMQQFATKLNEKIKSLNDKDEITSYYERCLELKNLMDVLLSIKIYQKQIIQCRQLVDYISQQFKEFYDKEIENLFQILEFFSCYDYLLQTKAIYKNLGLDVFGFEIKQIYELITVSYKQFTEIDAEQDKINKKINKRLLFLNEFQNHLQKLVEETYQLCMAAKKVQDEFTNQVKEKFQSKAQIIELRSLLKVFKENIIELYVILKALFIYELLCDDYQQILNLQKKSIKYQKLFAQNQEINQNQLQLFINWDFRQMKIYQLKLNHQIAQYKNLTIVCIKLLQIIEQAIEDSLLYEQKLPLFIKEVQRQCQECKKIQYKEIDLSKFDEHCKQLEKQSICNIM